jgi:hypothetical protein
MDSCATILRIKHDNGGVVLPVSNSRDGDVFTPVWFCVDGEYGRIRSSVTDITRQEDTRFIVLVGCDDQTASNVGKMLRNCLVIKPDFKGVSDQHHVLPLGFGFAALWWYGCKEVVYSRTLERNLDKLPINGFQTFIDGQLYDWEQICGTCTHRMEKVAGLCRPLHPTCGINSMPFGAGALARHDRGKVNSWFRAHAMDYARVEYKSFPLKLMPLKKVCANEPFCGPGIDSVTLDTGRRERARQLCEDNRRVATRTLIMRNRMCKQCMRDGLKTIQGEKYGPGWRKEFRCPHLSGATCPGIFSRHTIRYAVDSCYPWMVHALLLSGRRGNFSEMVPLAAARKPFYRNANIVGPYASAGEMVRVSAAGNVDNWSPSVSYERACDVVGVLPVRDWESLRDMPDPAFPDRKLWRGDVPLHIKILARQLSASRFVIRVKWNASRQEYDDVCLRRVIIHPGYVELVLKSITGVTKILTFDNLREIFEDSYMTYDSINLPQDWKDLTRHIYHLSVQKRIKADPQIWCWLWARNKDMMISDKNTLATKTRLWVEQCRQELKRKKRVRAKKRRLNLKGRRKKNVRRGAAAGGTQAG